MNPLSALEKAAALQILDFIYEAGEATRSDVEAGVQGSSGTIGSTLVVLGEMGLLEERRGVRYQKRYISLSPLGKKIANHIHEIKITINAES